MSNLFTLCLINMILCVRNNSYSEDSYLVDIIFYLIVLIWIISKQSFISSKVKYSSEGCGPLQWVVLQLLASLLYVCSIMSITSTFSAWNAKYAITEFNSYVPYQLVYYRETFKGLYVPKFFVQAVLSIAIPYCVTTLAFYLRYVTLNSRVVYVKENNIDE